ncbi:CoA transferase [Nocardia gamkensis]|uniref:CoA transferase n=1 Tax=Nocardia gamkensis TaxID=352869 RepID=UPI0037CA709F
MTTLSPEAAWAAGGLARLTGLRDGPPDFTRAVILSRAAAVAGGFTARTGVRIDVPVELSGRAALSGASRRGRVSVGGASRLLATRDGWCALTLSRTADLEAIPALLETAAPPEDPWAAVAAWAAHRPSAAVTERARLLDIPAATLGEADAAPPRVRPLGERSHPRPVAECLVADLTSMWAGPLCGRLLAAAGATVVKVESPRRPDGPRRGSPTFFDWMNAGKLCYAADFDADGAALRELLEVADVVLEGSRPAALMRRGLGPDRIARRPGRVWLRVTAYGTDGRDADRPGFGDDTAVAGGLVGEGDAGPVFCADAIADPLTGLESARAVAESLARGGGELIEVSLAAVAATYAAMPPGPADAPYAALAPTPPPRPASRASALGADTTAVRQVVAARRSLEGRATLMGTPPRSSR